MIKRTRIFLLLSIAIAVIDGVFVWVNNSFATMAFKENLEQEGQRLHSSFDTLLAQTYANMLAMATFISNDHEVQQMFLAGKKAVEVEGGGPGGELAQLVRARLYNKVGPNWKEVQKDFKVRQLHFHLGPGSTSFLRVHRPDKFGDNMDNVRFTIVDTNKERTPRSGFETGRVYSGLRGVVPVSAWDAIEGTGVHVGALEVGTSFDVILNILDKRYDLGVGVLLTNEHVASAMWPDFVKNQVEKNVHRYNIQGDCDCYYEATTRDNIAAIIEQGLTDKVRFRDTGTHMIEADGVPYAVSHFPLRDYLGNRDATRADAGAILFWSDATEKKAALENTHFFNIVYGVIGYLLVEILLFLGFRFGLRRLEMEVAQRTAELNESKQDLERKAVELSDFANREVALNQQLKYEVDVKNRFFSIISHDLKSPFTALLGMTQMMKEMADSFSKDKLIEYAGNINQSGSKIFDLLQNLLEWSQVQMEGGQCNLEQVSLREVVEECLGVLEPVAGSKNISIRSTIEDTSVYTDRYVILTVLRNLVTNAIKFTPAGGGIEMSSQRQEGWVDVSVRDNGVGMTDAYARDIFALDEKTTTQGTDGETGTGLGLPLCKQLLEKCGGDIKVESVPDKGTTFSFRLPTGAPEEHQTPG